MSDQSTLVEHAERTGETITDATRKLLMERPTLAKLAELRDAEERVIFIQRQIDLLKDREGVLRDEVTKEYLERQEKRFSGFDWKRALAGARVDYQLTVAKTSTYFLRMPTGARTHEVRSFLMNPGDLGPVSQAEELLLAWLAGLQLLEADANKEAPPRQDFLKLPPVKLLPQLRHLPEPLLNRLADEILTLQQWLNLKLENELGNS